MCIEWKMGVSQEDILYGKSGRLYLRYKDVCKRDMKALDMNPEFWEELA
jgi:hypothetical protein